jgi:Peptidase A4 family
MSALNRFARADQVLREKFPGLIATNLKGAYALPAPPDNFDPRKASTDELAKHALFSLPAPHNPALAKAWERVFSPGRHAEDWVVPELKPQVGRTHHYFRSPLIQAADGNFVVTTWAGAAIQGGSWTSNAGIWEIPTVSQPKEGAGEEGGWNSSSWIGIDGYNLEIASNDVLQAGVQQKVDTNGKASYTAWFEWYAPPEAGSPSYIYQTNLDIEVSPGDQIFCWVLYIPLGLFGLKLGYIVFVNMTTGKGGAVLLAPPPGATAAGNTIEWIMEAPDGGEPTSSLPKFTPFVFSVPGGGSGDPNNPQIGDTLNIENVAGQVLTSVTVGNDTVAINFIC